MSVSLTDKRNRPLGTIAWTHYQPNASVIDMAQFIRRRTGQYPISIHPASKIGAIVRFPTVGAARDFKQRFAKMDKFGRGKEWYSPKKTKKSKVEFIKNSIESAPWKSTTQWIDIIGVRSDIKRAKIVKYFKNAANVSIEECDVYLQCYLKNRNGEMHAIIDCKSHETAMKVVKELNMSTLIDKMIWIQLRKPMKGCYLKIFNVHPETSEEDLMTFILENQSKKDRKKKSYFTD